MKSLHLNIFFAIALALTILAGGVFLGYEIASAPSESGSGCTMEAKECPDGSYVGRTGPNCEFAACPATSGKSECTKDADCPSSDYACEATQGVGTISPGNSDDGGVFEITNGVCKKREGKSCSRESECVSGLLCHQGKCTNPQGQQCASSSDRSCPSGYTCIQDCGPPIVPPGGVDEASYHCVLNEQAEKPRICPICLAANTMIATPLGQINVRNLREGDSVWSLDRQGKRIASNVLALSHTAAPVGHKVVHLVLSDGREVWVSPNHPTADSRAVGALKADEQYDGAKVVSAKLVFYWDAATYDLLLDSGTGYYWANGILLGSTLKR